MHSPQQLILRPDVDGKHLGKHLLVLLSLAITCKTNKKNWTWCNYLQIAAVVVSKVIYRNRLYLCQIQEKGKASLVWTKIFLCIQFQIRSTTETRLQRKLNDRKSRSLFAEFQNRNILWVSHCWHDLHIFCSQDNHFAKLPSLFSFQPFIFILLLLPSDSFRPSTVLLVPSLELDCPTTWNNLDKYVWQLEQIYFTF